MNTILTTIVGSHAHGLAGPNSDLDYRGVFIQPTSEILRLGGHVRSTNWMEGNIDDTAYELAHFLHLATKSNPSILEVFLAPVVAEKTTELGYRVRELFPFVWNSVDVRNAFVGYGLNQRKKMLDDKDAKRAKFAVAYLRTLIQGAELLNTGTFNVEVGSDANYGKVLKAWKAGKSAHYPYDVLTPGEVVDTCLGAEAYLNAMFAANPRKETDIDKINTFLLDVRKENWE